MEGSESLRREFQHNMEVRVEKMKCELHMSYSGALDPKEVKVITEYIGKLLTENKEGTFSLVGADGTPSGLGYVHLHSVWVPDMVDIPVMDAYIGRMFEQGISRITMVKHVRNQYQCSLTDALAQVDRYLGTKKSVKVPT